MPPEDTIPPDEPATKAAPTPVDVIARFPMPGATGEVGNAIAESIIAALQANGFTIEGSQDPEPQPEVMAASDMDQDEFEDVEYDDSDDSDDDDDDDSVKPKAKAKAPAKRKARR